MPFLENVFSFVSPTWAMRRHALRQFTNSYQGGLPTRDSEGWSRATGYRFGTAGDRTIITNTRDRAYNAYDNNPVAGALVDIETDNVIGDGLNYQPTSSSEAWNKEAKDRYYEWLDNCSIRGGDTETGCEIQRQAWAYSRIAGDIGWVLHNRDYVDPKTNTLIVNSRIQLVRAENIQTPDGLLGDARIFDGIRFDEDDKPTTFYVAALDERGRREFKSVPARDFVWLPQATGPCQARPPSCYVRIFDRLAHLERYFDGVALAAWMGTVFGLLIKDTRASTQYGNLPLTTNSKGEQQRAITLENGAIKYLGTEGEVAQVNAQQPMQQTPEFIRTMMRAIGQPFKMPLEVIALDMSTCTFASARIGLLPFYRQCRIKAGNFASRWSRTIRWWLSRERLRGPNDPNRWDNAFPSNYWSHDLLVNEWQYTDPVSEPQADLLQIDMGTKSTQQVIAERGRDAELILRERREWMEKTKDLPQINSTMTRHPQSGVGATGDPLGKEQVEPPKPAPPPNEDKPNDNQSE